MYYKLNPKFRLRGWEKATCTLTDCLNKIVRRVDQRSFPLLILCDGITFIDEDELTLDEQKILKNFVNQNIIESREEPSPIADVQQYRYYDNRYFDSIIWSITGRCNFHCRHCYMDAPHNLYNELPIEAIKDILLQLKECGIYSVVFTGGEPFVRKDFWEIVDYMIDKGIHLEKIYTNGWMLTEDTFRKFEDRKIFPAISISFDGLGWHDWMRGRENAEERTIKAIKACVHHKVPLDVEFCLHNGNLSVLRSTINYLASVGLRDLKVGLVQNTPLWIQNAEGNMMTRKEYFDALLDYVPRFFEDAKPMNVLLGGAMHLLQGEENYRLVIEKSDSEQFAVERYLCGAARSNAYISPEGRFLPCMSITSIQSQDRFPLIMEVGVRKCMSDSYYMNFIGNRVGNLLERNKKCNACQYRYKCCGGCRAIAMMENDGDLYASDPEACFVFENGYPEKFRKAADDAIAKYCKEEP